MGRSAGVTASATVNALRYKLPNCRIAGNAANLTAIYIFEDISDDLLCYSLGGREEQVIDNGFFAVSHRQGIGEKLNPASFFRRSRNAATMPQRFRFLRDVPPSATECVDIVFFDDRVAGKRLGISGTILLNDIELDFRPNTNLVEF